jgi:hypothetical protein
MEPTTESAPAVAAATVGTSIAFGESSSLAGAFVGQQVDGSAVLLSYTRLGDTDLDRDVELSDLGNMASNFGAASGKFWTKAILTSMRRGPKRSGTAGDELRHDVADWQR